LACNTAAAKKTDDETDEGTFEWRRSHQRYPVHSRT